LDLDNNAAELALRPAVVARKNFYGSGSEWSAALAVECTALAARIPAGVCRCGWAALHRYRARNFSLTELDAVVELIQREPKLNRAHLSRRVCEMLNWRTSDGKLEDMSCRVAMLRMQADGLIELPASRIRQRRRRAQVPATSRSDPQSPLTQPVHELSTLRLEIVQAASPHAKLCNEYMARYHELGYTPL